MFEKSGKLGQVEYTLQGPSRLSGGEHIVIHAEAKNLTAYPRWFRISAIEGKGGEWLLNRGIGLVDLRGEEKKEFTADLGTLPAEVPSGEVLLRLNLSTLGATEQFSYILKTGISPAVYAVPAVLLLAVAIWFWRRHRAKTVVKV